MAKRISNKFWFKNEKEVMEKLGLEPVPGSGSGVRKEDGENDYILCQLKSTSAESISIKKIDVEKLYYHADQIGKIPLFVIQFLNGPLLIASPPDELKNLSKYLNNELFEKAEVETFEFIEQPKQRNIVKGTTKGKKRKTFKDEKNDGKLDAYQARKLRQEAEAWKKRRAQGLE